MCILPLFYFMASASFRRDSEAHGLAKAIWIAVFKDYSGKLGILSPIQGSEVNLQKPQERPGQNKYEKQH